MNKHELLERVTENKYTHEKLLAWIKVLPNTTSKIKPIEFKMGDVCMHGVFQHPYVLLKKTTDGWICGMLTSEETCPEILEACESRFFSNGFFTKMLLTVNNPQGAYIASFDNNKQLRRVYKQLTNILSNIK